MIKRIIVSFLMIFVASESVAQSIFPLNRRLLCSSDSASMMKVMKDEFKENIFSIGLTDISTTIIIFRNKETKKFTILEIFPNNTGCIIAAGKEFEELE